MTFIEHRRPHSDDHHERDMAAAAGRLLFYRPLTDDGHRHAPRFHECRVKEQLSSVTRRFALDAATVSSSVVKCAAAGIGSRQRVQSAHLTCLLPQDPQARLFIPFLSFPFLRLFFTAPFFFRLNAFSCNPSCKSCKRFQSKKE